MLFVNGANSLFDLDQVPDDWLVDRRVVSLGSMFILPQFTGEAVGRLLPGPIDMVRIPYSTRRGTWTDGA